LSNGVESASAVALSPAVIFAKLSSLNDCGGGGSNNQSLGESYNNGIYHRQESTDSGGRVGGSVAAANGQVEKENCWH